MTDPIEGMRCLLRAVFPDDRIAIADELVHATIGALPENIKHTAFGDVLREVDDALGGAPTEDDAGVLDYWIAKATHERHGVHRFVGRVPMVRVRLPEKQTDILTRCGTVFAGDHKLYTLAIAREYLDPVLDYEPDRIDLLTPARWMGARFAGVATYALWHGDHVRGFVLEAGMATGEAMVLYTSPEGDTISRMGQYVPTPFSNMRNFYGGLAVFGAMGDPQRMNVTVSEKRDVPEHITVRVVYERVEHPGECFHSALTAEAAARVCLIGQHLKRPVPGVPDFMVTLLAEWAKTMEWEVKP